MSPFVFSLLPRSQEWWESRAEQAMRVGAAHHRVPLQVALARSVLSTRGGFPGTACPRRRSAPGPRRAGGWPGSRMLRRAWRSKSRRGALADVGLEMWGKKKRARANVAGSARLLLGAWPLLTLGASSAEGCPASPIPVVAAHIRAPCPGAALRAIA